MISINVESLGPVSESKEERAQIDLGPSSSELASNTHTSICHPGDLECRLWLL